MKLQVEVSGKVLKTYDIICDDCYPWQRDLAVRQLIQDVQREYYYLFETCEVYFYLLIESKMNGNYQIERKQMRAA